MNLNRAALKFIKNKNGGGVENGTKLFLVSVIAAPLAGCGGGSGGSTPSVVIPTIQFTSSSAITNPSIVVMSGASQEVKYTASNNVITSLSNPTSFQTGGSVTQTLDSKGNPTSMTVVSGAGTTISLITANGDTIAAPTDIPGLNFSYSKNKENEILGVTMAAEGWNYQTFGVWETGVGTGSGTVGAMTMGAATPGASIPTTGSYTYNGKAGGIYSNSSGNSYLVGATMTANVDYAARSIAFSTSNSQTFSNSYPTPNSSLNLTGSLSYTAGTNLFTGNVSSAGGGSSNSSMPGTASGKFYGPTASEIGGTFALKGSGVAGYIGGFGGK